jgi:hypothetical protein
MRGGIKWKVSNRWRMSARIPSLGPIPDTIPETQDKGGQDGERAGICLGQNQVEVLETSR